MKLDEVFIGQLGKYVCCFVYIPAEYLTNFKLATIILKFELFLLFPLVKSYPNRSCSSQSQMSSNCKPFQFSSF